MEWVEDVQLFVRKGAANPSAYRMAAPLLADILHSLKVCCILTSPVSERPSSRQVDTSVLTTVVQDNRLSHVITIEKAQPRGSKQRLAEQLLHAFIAAT